MSEVEEAEHGDRGRVREWLARAVHAPRDPAWTADGDHGFELRSNEATLIRFGDRYYDAQTGQPYHPGVSVNHLTAIRLDPISQQANLKTHLCRVAKATV